jgi:hypothetical protein
MASDYRFGNSKLFFKQNLLNNELIKHHPTVKYASLVTASNLPELYSKINSGFLNLITIQVITM